MGPIDIVIIVAVMAALALCVRHLARGEGECSSCSSAGTCAVHASGKGYCPQAARMLADADRALGSTKRSR